MVAPSQHTAGTRTTNRAPNGLHFLGLLVTFVGAQFPNRAPDLVVTEPRPGESYSRGSDLEIRWKVRPGAQLRDHVAISLYLGDTYYQAITPSAKNDGEYSWFIPPSFRAYGYYKIAVAYGQRRASKMLHDQAFTKYFAIVEPTMPPTPRPTPSPTPLPATPAPTPLDVIAPSFVQQATKEVVTVMHNPQQRTVLVAGMAGLIVAVSICNIIGMLRSSRTAREQQHGAEMAQISEQSVLMGTVPAYQGQAGMHNLDLSTDV